MSEQLPAHENIERRGFTTVEIAASKDDLQEAIDCYTDFLTLPERYHEPTRFYLSSRGDGDFGQYTRVAGSNGERGEVPDNKDIFHFGERSRQYIETSLPGKMPSEMKRFLDAAEEIYWAGQRSKRNVLEELDFCGSSLLSVLHSKLDTPNDLLRFITYYPNEEKLAKGHFDRSSCTLAIGESHEGLRLTRGQNGMVVNADETYLADLESRLTPVEHVSGEAKFFLGAGWNHLPDQVKGVHQNLELGWHDVVPSAKRVGEKVMRWAVVMFINPYTEMKEYQVPTPPETRPYKQLGRLTAGSLCAG